jgi:hypothetical protein
VTAVPLSRSRDEAPASEVRAAPQARSTWRSVALPAEHGGWGLTLEPAVLGLALVWSWAGLAIAACGLLAFLARTPLKLAAVDRRRGRSLPRTALARRLAAVEVGGIILLAALCLWSAGPAWTVPVAVAAPLVGLELWFDVRSRSRRLVPELCGSVAMGGLAAAVVLAGGGSAIVAGVAWGLLAARSVCAVPWVRAEVLRLHRRATAGALRGADAAQGLGSAVAGLLVIVEPAALAGAVAVAGTAVLRVIGLRSAPWPAVRLGVAETVMGTVVVIATAVGLHLGGVV